MLLVYVIIKSGVFLLAREYELKSLSHMGRLSYFSSGGAVCLALGILSLGGLPPLFGFSIKFVSLRCLVSKGRFLLAGLLVLGRLLRLFFYLRVAFKSVLVLFPQHSLVAFGWRNAGTCFSLGSTLRGLLVGFRVSLRLFGLCCFPLLFSFL